MSQQPKPHEPLRRIPREWTESCSRCGGTGHVQKRERFTLRTPDEGHVDPLDPKHDVPRDAYVCHAWAGTSIFEVCKEAVEIAARVKRPVAFEFNGRVVVAREDSVPTALARAWWRLVYGETPEESAAKR